MVTTTTPRSLTCAETAKLVRKALAQAFPGCKFTVRSKTYSGGASIHVEWIDGPTTPQVETITRQYSGATFDALIDLKEYHTSTLAGETVHYGADHVFCQRQYSPAFLQLVADRVAATWGCGTLSVTLGYEYIADRHLTPLLPDGSGDTLGDRIHATAYQTPVPGYAAKED